MQAQRLDPMIRELNRPDLDVDNRRYFGAPLHRLANADEYGLDPNQGGTVTRLSYVFQAVYNNGDDYGGIQLRGRVHTFGEPPQRYREILEETAHRAAHMYNSGIQTMAYINGSGVEGTAAGSGYLDGFNAIGVYSNWETEPVPANRAGTDPGVIDWSVEVYEESTFDHADLAGIAQGISRPYYSETRKQPGQPEVSIPPHKWGIAGPHDSRPEYYELRPPARTEARDRYREGVGRGKDVYINDKKVGTTDNKGRVWLKIEYGSGDGHSWGDKYSRKGVVETTEATYQAIRSGGTLYLTGESEERIDLVTARAKPEGYRAADPDAVGKDVEVQDGQQEGEYQVLRLRDTAAQLTCEARRDDAVTWALGMSSPDYHHRLDRRQRWEPGLEGDPNHNAWGGGGGR